MNKTKIDKMIDLGLRSLIFCYSVVILSLSIWQLNKDRQFLIVMGIFAVTCTSIYLFDIIYELKTGRRIRKLFHFIHGSQEFSEELPEIKKVFRIICYLCVLLVAMHLFGIFLVIFFAIATFPVFFDRRNYFISIIVAVITTSLFYYLFVYMMGVQLYEGLIIGF
jgi:hypothetical protein